MHADTIQLLKDIHSHLEFLRDNHPDLLADPDSFQCSLYRTLEKARDYIVDMEEVYGLEEGECSNCGMVYGEHSDECPLNPRRCPECGKLDGHEENCSMDV